jgi:hypothetical protein
LAETQIALELAVGEVTGLAGFELKRVMRTGTVASVDNRNWEIGDPTIIQRLSQSRAIALDMESAAIAANGFRFHVPYGTLLCVSDKPLHGEIKLAGMAGEFYRQRVDQHLEIGVRALEKLRPRIGNACIRASSEASPKSRSNSSGTPRRHEPFPTTQARQRSQSRHEGRRSQKRRGLTSLFVYHTNSNWLICPYALSRR